MALCLVPSFGSVVRRAQKVGRVSRSDQSKAGIELNGMPKRVAILHFGG